jgi:heme exporter protein A
MAVQIANASRIIDAMQSRARLLGATVVMDDRAVLRSLDLELDPGITVLRGPNGAGKTTALRALAGLVPLARGSREIDGDLLYLGHRPHLLHGLTARENLSFFSSFRRMRSNVDDALGRWRLGPDADRPVEKLSAGQRRRAALARLDTEPLDVVLLDEPFAELDDEAMALLRASLRAARDRGARILVASHGHAELDADAACVYSMRDGAAVRSS